ncbi:MAG: hypothetical protein BGO07_04270 [Alphaproteobacteria bacterium 40-19]|nr:MAG: hypothetical protein BGO07_04270 [Alphaproteobacteria bacterium 40-19]
MSLFFISKFCTLVGVFVFAKPLWATWLLQDLTTFEQWVEGQESFQEKVNKVPSEKEVENKKESGFRKKLFEYAKKYVHEMMDLPFVKGIEKKSLTAEQWAYYLFHDYGFLEEVSYVSLKVATDACQFRQNGLKDFLLKMHNDVSTMTKGWKDRFKILVKDYSGEEWNSNCFSKEMSAKEKYSDFLSRLARYPDFVAFLPCYLSYFVIAKKFSFEHTSAGLPETELSPWVLYNSDPEVEKDIRTMINFAAQLYNTKNKCVMERILKEAFRHEVAFFRDSFFEKTTAPSCSDENITPKRVSCRTLDLTKEPDSQ